MLVIWNDDKVIMEDKLKWAFTLFIICRLKDSLDKWVVYYVYGPMDRQYKD